MTITQIRQARDAYEAEIEAAPEWVNPTSRRASLINRYLDQIDRILDSKEGATS